MWCSTMFNIGTSTFIVCMSDIYNAPELLFSIMYANDTSVQIIGIDIIYLVSSLNVQLELLSSWLKTNKLSPKILSFSFFTWQELKIMCSVFELTSLL